MKRLGLAMVLGSVAAFSQAGLIDNFTQGSYDTGLLTSGNDFQWLAAGNVPGGVRAHYFEIEANDIGDDGRARTFLGPGIFSVTSGAGVDVYAEIGYGFGTNSTIPNLPLNLDFTASPIFSMDVRSTDVATPYKVILGSLTLGQSASRSGSLPGGVTPSMGVTSSLDFSGEAVLADVDYILIQFDPPVGGDFSITKIQTVPEPGTIAGVGLALAAFARRRKKA
jgi:hypothetical protein